MADRPKGKVVTMIPITNTKVETLGPTWARFVGYSLLFDNPGDSVRDLGRFEQVHCEVEAEPELGLYRQLSLAFSEIAKPESSDLGLCPLPPSSYHVTVFDGGNQANVDGAHPDYRSSLAALIEGLPDSWDVEYELVRPLAQSSLATSTSLDFRFCYSHLKCPGNAVLVAALKPADDASRDKLEQFVSQRAMLSDSYREAYGIGAGMRYSPHVSIAYLANLEGGEKAATKIEEWDRLLRERTEGLTLRFNSVSVYAFTDMATFFRVRPAA